MLKHYINCPDSRKVGINTTDRTSRSVGFISVPSGLILSFAFTLLLLSPSFGQTPAPTPTPQVELHLSFDPLSKWQTKSAQLYEKGIPVCWENMTDNYKGDGNIVREAITSTWQKYSAVRFNGWQKCSPSNAGIRILIEDSGPHTKGLGNRLDGLVNGMVLNFSFKAWSEACNETEKMRLFCVRSIAVHEFGHALGFAHEQNRSDAPGECRLLKQGSDGPLFLTPYDPSSVMNYCNPKYNNNGMLSEKDIMGLQAVYDAPPSLTLPFSNSRKMKD